MSWWSESSPRSAVGWLHAIRPLVAARREFYLTVQMGGRGTALAVAWERIQTAQLRAEFAAERLRKRIDTWVERDAVHD